MEKIFVSNISFEALIRELFINIVTPTEIRDEKRSIYILNPVKHVVKTNWSGIDIDVLAFIDENTVNIFEYYFGEKAGIKKIRQILKASKIVLDRGYKINIAGCISYFGFKENILDIARKHNIALISRRQLKKIKEINGLKFSILISQHKSLYHILSIFPLFLMIQKKFNHFFSQLSFAFSA